MGGLTPIASPCTGVCTLDADRCCIGCGRTLDEIARWSGMDPAERAVVIERVGAGSGQRPPAQA